MKIQRAAGLVATAMLTGSGCSFHSVSDKINAVAQEEPNVRQAGVSQLMGLNLNVRGVNAVAETGSGGIVVDGIAMSNPAVLTRTFPGIVDFRLDKGPQGRGASAASIVVVNMVPTNTFAGNARVTVADDNTYAAQAAAGGPITTDKLHYGLSAAFNTTDGFFRNSFLDAAKVDNASAFELGGRLLLALGENSGLDLKINWSQRKAADSDFDGALGLPVFAQFLNQPLFNEDINRHQYSFHSNLRPEHRQRAADASLRWIHDLAWAKLDAWTLYSDVDNSLVMDGASGIFGTFNDEPACRASTAAQFAAHKTLPTPQRLGSTPETSLFGVSTFTTCDGTHTQVRDQNDISVDVRLSSPDSSTAFTWNAGMFFQHVHRIQGSSLGIDTGKGASRDLFVPAGGLNPTEQLYADKFTTRALSAFADASYDLFKTLTITAGVRQEIERQSVSNRIPAGVTTRYLTYVSGEPQTGGAPLNPGLDPFVNASGTLAPQRATNKQTSPKVGLSWQARADTTLHASWNTGFKSGGFNNLGTAATVDLLLNGPLNAGLAIGDSFAKERSSAFEGGFETKLFDGAFTFGAVGYYTRVRNLQFAELLAGPFGLLRAVENIDRARITGAEAKAEIKFGDTLRIFGGASAQTTRILAMTGRPEAVGNALPYAPEYTANGGAELRWPIIQAFNFVSRADFSVTGPTAFHPLQCETRPTVYGVPGSSCGIRDRFMTVDLRAGVSNKAWEVAVFVKNVTNDRHIGEAIVIPELGYTFIRPGALRRIGADVRYTF